MTEEHKKPTTKKKTAPKKKVVPKVVENPDRVAVLTTHVGFPLVIRGNPTEDKVRGFVAEHNRRYHQGEAGGPSGIPAYLIHEANFYPSELEMEDSEKATPIAL